MTEFEQEGYEDLRTYLQDNWAFISVVDDDDTEQIRLEIDVDDDTSWESGPGSNPLTAEMEITGSMIEDEGGELPVTLTETQVFKSSSASTVMASDTMTDATLEAQNDTVTITHDYEMPQQ